MIDRRLFVQQLSSVALLTVIQSDQRIAQNEFVPLLAARIQARIERIRIGEVGDVTHIFGYCYRGRASSNAADKSITIAPQHLDVANRIFGESVQNIFAAHKDHVDGTMEAMLTYSDDRRFVFRSMVSRAEMNDQLWVYGTRGSMNFSL